MVAQGDRQYSVQWNVKTTGKDFFFEGLGEVNLGWGSFCVPKIRLGSRKDFAYMERASGVVGLGMVRATMMTSSQGKVRIMGDGDDYGDGSDGG